MDKEERMRRSKDQSPTATASAEEAPSPDDTRLRPRVRYRGRTREKQARSSAPHLPTQGRTQVSPEQAPVPWAPSDDTHITHCTSTLELYILLFSFHTLFRNKYWCPHYILLVNSLPERRQAQGSLRWVSRGRGGQVICIEGGVQCES